MGKSKLQTHKEKPALLHSRVKNPHDPRFRKNHRRLFAAYNKLMASDRFTYIYPLRISKKAKVGRNTFARHFPSPNKILRMQEQELYLEFKQHLTTLKDRTPAAVLTCLCVFILRHRDFFCATVSHNNFRLFHQLVWEVQKELTTDWRTYGTAIDTRNFSLFLAGLELIMHDWHQFSFNKEYLDQAAKHFINYHKTFTANLSIIHNLSRAQTG